VGVYWVVVVAVLPHLMEILVKEVVQVLQVMVWLIQVVPDECCSLH
jgi:hypothetical protein